jgi:hypothetical protein
MLTISPDKLAYIIEKAREFDVEVEPETEDEASDAIDDRAGMVGALRATGDNPAEQELAEALGALNEDERADVLALMWLGRGDFDASEWRDGLEQAHQAGDERDARYLMGTPLLADYLEQGQALLGDADDDTDDDTDDAC